MAKRFSLIARSGPAPVMVFLGLVHMLMTVPNLVFLFMSPPLISFGFWSSYQLLIRFSAHDRGGRQARRQGAEGESKRSKEGGKAKGGGEGNRRKASMSVAGREFDCKRRMTFLCRAWASGSSRSFRIHERVVPPESRGARRAHAAAAAGCRNQRKWETTAWVRKGVSRLAPTSNSPSAHPAREVAGVRRHGAG
jgi:hypothetical protein